ncbi:hypothetical protein BH11BAC1_BH11BAC1_22300 [soil metagenome]
MKKNLLFLVAAGLISFGSFAQCVPDTSVTHNEPGVYPDSATNLPHAIVGIPYSTVIQLKVLTDTTTMIGPITVPVTIDSIIATNIAGLPAGYTYNCTPITCVFLGGSDACILLQGPAPTGAEIGMVYNIHVEVTVYGHITGTGTTLPAQSANVDYYYIQVDDNVGISSLGSSKFEVLQNNPNPFHGISTVEYVSPKASMITVKVSNMLGKTIFTKMVWAKSGMNKITFNAKEFEPGIYFYTISSDKNSVTKRMIVDNE